MMDTSEQLDYVLNPFMEYSTIARSALERDLWISQSGPGRKKVKSDSERRKKTKEKKRIKKQKRKNS
jgi:hypothetical protein